MANVQFGGLITGLDTKALIGGLVQAESRPVALLQNQKTLLQARQGVYSALVGALGGLKNAAQRLSLASDFNKRAASSRDRKSTRLNSSHIQKSRMPSSA